jgi:hypothetical protein
MNTPTMYDSVPQKWPAEAVLILAYFDGPATAGNYAAARAAFPHATIKKCTTVGTPGADIADHEKGDLDIDDPSYEIQEAAHGNIVTIYLSQDNLAVYQAAAARRGFTDYKIGTADWDGVATLPPGQVFRQYATNPDYDTSIVDPAWAFPTPPPPPPEPPPMPPALEPQVNIAMIPGDTIVASIPRGAGTITLTRLGAIYAIGTTFWGCPLANVNGEDWAAQGRSGATLEPYGISGYTAKDQTGSPYTYGH